MAAKLSVGKNHLIRVAHLRSEFKMELTFSEIDVGGRAAEWTMWQEVCRDDPDDTPGNTWAARERHEHENCQSHANWEFWSSIHVPVGEVQKTKGYLHTNWTGRQGSTTCLRCMWRKATRLS